MYVTGSAPLLALIKNQLHNSLCSCVKMHCTYSGFHIAISKREVRMSGFPLLWVRLPLIGSLSIALEVKRSIRGLLLPGELSPFLPPPKTTIIPYIHLSFWAHGNFSIYVRYSSHCPQRDYTCSQSHLSHASYPVTLPPVTQQFFLTKITAILFWHYRHSLFCFEARTGSILWTPGTLSR